jgi:hypothetical protein
MNTALDNILTIKKELLDTIHFPPEEILVDPDKINPRKHNAQRTMKLGNLYNDKVKVVFGNTMV